MATVMPECALSARCVEDPGPDRDDETTRLKLRDEVRWLHDAASWVSPSQQCLDTRQRTGLEINGRLVDEEELVGLEGAAQVDGEGSVVLGRILHLLAEDDRAPLSTGLGAIHGGVRISEQLVGSRTVACGDTDARGHSDRRVALFDVERCTECVQDPLGNDVDAVAQGVALDEENKFVAAKSADGVTLA